VEKRLLGNRPLCLARAVKNGDASFFGLGVPMLAAQGAFSEEELKKTALANSAGGTTASRTPSTSSISSSWRSLRLYAAYLWDLCTAVVLPFEYVSVAEAFIERLDELKAGAEGIGLAGASEAARGLQGLGRDSSSRGRGLAPAATRRQDGRRGRPPSASMPA
jgi:hypothetical protein